jgi:hypothetical protein
MDPGECSASWRADSDGTGLEGRPRCDFRHGAYQLFGFSVTRVNHARELRHLDQAPFYETVEWMTLTADGPSEFLDLELGWARFL